jgi:lipopolysaccharide transport system ATP-binding protein
MSKAIKVENLSKAYQIGEFGTGTLSNDLQRWWALARGKEDPLLMVGETNIRSKKGDSNVVWSLKDLNFEVQRGEAIGIIGKNGAGKSTLLKLLSKVTSPTTGKIRMNGRVASLLEVGTGFHPELTGRENIFLNGAILGMQKDEVRQKFDSIVDFSGVERYIDTPVKRYSSGMYVRLAFAVAAHLDSEILIIDEVLAVGDAEFQKKCIGKMGDISKNEGRTILFVSHNMDSVLNLCQSSIILKNGTLSDFGKTSELVNSYLNNSNLVVRDRINEQKDIIINEAVVKNINSKKIFSYSDEIVIEILYEIKKPFVNTIIWLDIRKNNNVIFCTSDVDFEDSFYKKRSIGKYLTTLKIPGKFLNSGSYDLIIGINSYKPDIEHDRVEGLMFRIGGFEESANPEFNIRGGLIKPILRWNENKF